MKTKLILFYETLLNNYFYYQNKDEETSKKFAYYSVRNIIGIVLFMFLLIFFVNILAVFKINLHLKHYRPLLYLLMAGVIIGYILLTKKYLKPIFDGIELQKEKPLKNNYSLYVVGIALFGGGMFVAARLITIYFS